MRTASARSARPDPAWLAAGKDDDVAFAALCLWEQDGRPAGRRLEYWFRAEALLREARQSL